jgi:hypothetical protein
MKGMRVAVMILLAFLGVGAVVGAVPMILWPLETQWNLLLVSVLQYSPFHSFLIPGIILLVSNGLLALWVLWLVIARRSSFELWTALQGCVLLGWLVVECWMIRAVGGAHYFYATIAIALIVLGLAMRVSPVHPERISHESNGLSRLRHSRCSQMRGNGDALPEGESGSPQGARSGGQSS